ncbi:hypothetical protein FDJ19_gp168 [Vibrio phage Ceto]|uniref:Lipoprotein n=1 Tax=Vibrio phage Ceto TaxID=2570300 RepID=A0A2H5BGP3_9CAUD|nr:hypothetical protein FDJ19_gp168 [Vibrio phage Ceto]AUG85130.1 hypothetical protein CETO_148 [Vibrio phage Ceto]
MSKLSTILNTTCLSLIISGCTFNFTIDTDYASQRDHGGPIEEEVTTHNKTETDPNVDANIEVPGAAL